MLEPSRAARMNAANARRGELPGFAELTEQLVAATWREERLAGLEAAIQRATNQLVLRRLLVLANNSSADADVRAVALDAVNRLDQWLTVVVSNESDRRWRAHYFQARQQIRRAWEDPSSIEQLAPVTVPPGSPIGAGY
jgi:hypothetical protein